MSWGDNTSLSNFNVTLVSCSDGSWCEKSILEAKTLETHKRILEKHMSFAKKTIWRLYTPNCKLKVEMPERSSQKPPEPLSEIWHHTVRIYNIRKQDELEIKSAVDWDKLILLLSQTEGEEGWKRTWCTFFVVFAASRTGRELRQLEDDSRAPVKQLGSRGGRQRPLHAT